jgi:hypothetical protein
VALRWLLSNVGRCVCQHEASAQVVQEFCVYEFPSTTSALSVTLARSGALPATALLLAVCAPHDAWTGSSAGEYRPAVVLVSCRRCRCMQARKVPRWGCGLPLCASWPMATHAGMASRLQTAANAAASPFALVLRKLQAAGTATSVCVQSMPQTLKVGHALSGHQQEAPHRPGPASLYVLGARQ